MPEGTDKLNMAQAIDSLLVQNTPQEKEASEQPSKPIEETQPNAELEDEAITTEAEEEEEAGVESQAEESEEEEVEEEVVEEQTLYRVKIDGEEMDVPLEELQKNYQLEKTAQQRLSQAAQERKTLDAEKTSLSAQREQYAQGLQELSKALQNQMPTQEEMNKLKEDDPYAYQELKLTQLEQQEALRQVSAQQQKLHQEKVLEEEKKLLSVIPEWQDPEKRTRETQGVVTYAKRMGFSDMELQNATDHRAIAILLKAKKYDELMSKDVPKAKKKIAKVTKTIKKGGVPKTKADHNSAQKKKAFDKFAKRGKLNDAVEYLLNK